MSNITITLTSLTSQKTDSIEISPSTTTLSDLCQYAVALLDLPSSDNLILTKNTNRLYTATSNNNDDSRGGTTLASAGVENGDLIVVIQSGNDIAPSATSAPTSAPAATLNNASSSVGGLDFSSLLSSVDTTVPPASESANNNSGGGLQFNLPMLSTASANTNNGNNNSGGLQFNLPMLSAGSHVGQQTTPVQWDGMTLDDAMHRNPNPDCFIKVLLDEQRHGNLMKELNYHSPAIAKKLKSSELKDAADIWRHEMQRSTLNSTMLRTMKSQKESEMQRRLRSNPMDAEANAYFGDKIRKQNVEAQYRQMMEEFPESMGRVLMLYIDAKVNDHPIQAFVDSGAQATIMSSKCAEQCGILHLLDTRFAGTAVGVGTGKILGRIHIAQMQVLDHYFPCTITIMDSEEGLGDKNMDFLLGLDMLKRHRCNIDLSKNALVFRVGDSLLEAKFLHEKDLAESKGGTKGFDADKNNEMIEKERQERMEEDKKEKTAEKMDEDD